MRDRFSGLMGLLWLCGLASTPVCARVPVSEVEEFYANPAVFTPVEPAAHAYATRFPSFAADGQRLAFARDGENQVVVLDFAAGASEVIAAPGLVPSGRDFTLSYDGRVLAFASDASPDKGGCGRQVSFRNMLTGSTSSSGGAACLEQPSKPVTPSLAKPYGYASNIRNNGLPSPSDSYDIYFRRSPPPFGKGEVEPECLTCNQVSEGGGRIALSTFSSQPVSNVAHRQNKGLWISPGGRRLAFVYSIAYQSCPVGDSQCGESGLVIADVTDSGFSVRRTLRLAERNRFHEVHGAANGNVFVISTSAALLPEDSDNDLDVYLYRLDQDRLTLLSEGITGSANDPRISGSGHYAIFTTDSVARIVPPPNDVQVIPCQLVPRPVMVTSEYHLVDLQGSVPRRARVLGEATEVSNSCFARILPLREGADLNHSGTRLALTTRVALAAGDTNAAQDVYVTANHFARDLIFDHGFD